MKTKNSSNYDDISNYLRVVVEGIAPAVVVGAIDVEDAVVSCVDDVVIGVVIKGFS